MKESILTSVVLPIALSLIMFGMGLSLKLTDFKRVIQFPKAVLLGVFNQLIVLPTTAYIIILVFGIKGGLAVGLMVIAACPGGTTSNLITHVSKGDTALSVTLTAISTVVTIFTIPIFTNIAIRNFTGTYTNISLPIATTFGSLVLITLIPVSFGMLIKKYYPTLALKADKPVRIFSIIIFIILVLGILIKNKEHVFAYFKEAGILALTLNVTTVLLGFILAKLFYLNTKQSITIAIESGIQNGTLALLIVLSLIHNATDDMVIIPAVYSIIMFFTGGIIMAYFGIRAKK